MKNCRGRMFVVLSLVGFLSFFCEENTPTGGVDNDSSGTEIDTCTEVDGPVCRCIDESDEVSYMVLYPNGNETLQVGGLDTIRYCSEIDETDYIENPTFELSVDGGKNWVSLSPLVLDKPEERFWMVPDSITLPTGTKISAVSDQCLIRIAVYDFAGDPLTDFDVSDEYFSIGE